MDSFERLVSDLAVAEIGETFNFLGDEVPGLDREGGAAVRRANLLRYLETRAAAPVVAIGEAGGYCGARWSGIAFTSERTLAMWGEPYAPTSLRPRGFSEQSATIVHGVLEECRAEEHVLLWNTVPTHPHRPGQPLSNRRPRAGETAAGAEYTQRLLQLVQPRVVVAVGRVAAAVLGDDLPVLRHPAQGGGPAFRAGMRALLEELGGDEGLRA